jgi:endonuclease-3
VPEVQGQGQGLAARAAEIVRRLRIAYAIDEPEPGDDDLVGELVGTLLSQNTSDVNSGRAFAALTARYPSWEAVRAAPEQELADTIRSGGLANVKARRIKELLDSLDGRELSEIASGDVVQARAKLRELPGVGPKTASCLLLFSLRRPAIPVDTHVHRVSGRIGFIGPKVSAEAAHEALERIVRPEAAYAFHVGVVTHGRRVCKAGRPLCSLCPLADVCDFYTGGAPS